MFPFGGVSKNSAHRSEFYGFGSAALPRAREEAKRGDAIEIGAGTYGVLQTLCKTFGAAISVITRTSGAVVVKTATPHGFSIGDIVRVHAVEDEGFDGVFQVSARSSSELRYSQPGAPDGTASSGYALGLLAYQFVPGATADGTARTLPEGTGRIWSDSTPVWNECCGAGIHIATLQCVDITRASWFRFECETAENQVSATYGAIAVKDKEAVLVATCFDGVLATDYDAVLLGSWKRAHVTANFFSGLFGAGSNGLEVFTAQGGSGEAAFCRSDYISTRDAEAFLRDHNPTVDADVVVHVNTHMIKGGAAAIEWREDGTHIHLTVDFCTASNGPPLLVSDSIQVGLLHLHGARLEGAGSAVDVTAATDAIGSVAGGLILDGCTLVAGGSADSIASDNDQTDQIRYYGIVNANEDPQSTISSSLVGDIDVDPEVT